MNIKKLNDKAVIPTRGSDSAAGYDLYSTEFAILKPGERLLFKTGLAMEIPDGYYGKISPRSGLAYKYGIDVLAGVIDSDYRDDVGVILINHGSADYNVLVGDRIAQIVFHQYGSLANGFFVVDKFLTEEDRGGGFGSTGK